MAQTLLGDGNVTASGVVRGDTVRAASLAKYEIGTDTKSSDLSQVLAAKRDRTDNTCHQTTSGFSVWFATPPSGYTFGEAQPSFNSTTEKWEWYVEGDYVAVDAESGTSTEDATSATFYFNDSGIKSFTATRFAAVESTENENYVTKSYVASQFSRDDTSKEIQNAALANAVRYPLGTAITSASTDKQLKDRISNLVTVTSADVALTLPSARSDGTLRDFLVRIEMDGTTTGGSPSISDLSAWEGDELPTFAAGTNYLLAITETKSSTWYVRCIELESHTASNSSAS